VTALSPLAAWRQTTDIPARTSKKRGFFGSYCGQPQQANLSEKLVAGHETFSGFLRLNRRRRDKLNVAEKANDAHNYKKAAPC
jgi:hypothetical protein